MNRLTEVMAERAAQQAATPVVNGCVPCNMMATPMLARCLQALPSMALAGHAMSLLCAEVSFKCHWIAAAMGMMAMEGCLR